MFFRKNKPSTDFNAIMQNKIETLATSGFLTEKLEAAIEDAAAKAIDNLFGRYGEFGKAIEEGLKSQMNIDLKQVGIYGYNEIVAKVVKQIVENAQLAPAQAQLEKMLGELFKTPPAEIKLCDLVNDFYEHLQENNHHMDGNRPTIILEKNDRDWWRIYMDGKENQSKYSCAISMGFTDKGECYTMDIDGKKIEKRLFLGNFYAFEQKLFQIYTSKVPVIIGDFDADDIESYSSRYES